MASVADHAGGRGGDMNENVRPDLATEAFVTHRNLLFTVAYEMFGSAADAEDVLQETWLRWAAVDHATVLDQRAYLVKIATRQALTRLRTLGRRKESYVGPWLPEPLLTAPDVAEDVELADRVARVFAAGLKKVGAEMSLEPVQVNGGPALIVRLNGEIDGVMAVRVEDGLVTGLYYVRNPEKLSRVERETAVSR
ncbi:sigma factor [Streptosporangium sp. NPDC087985]|uniref:sigma factor n=1 Tax=Streptosporangium sp. NPDC087985 TaxID=3366196 RepID=UPI003806ABB9